MATLRYRMRVANHHNSTGLVSRDTAVRNHNTRAPFNSLLTFSQGFEEHPPLLKYAMLAVHVMTCSQLIYHECYGFIVILRRI